MSIIQAQIILPKPQYTDVIEVIHKAGGLAFLAHPFEYRFNDTINFINELRKEKELDGIECFHPSANEEEMKILVEYAKRIIYILVVEVIITERKSLILK